MNKNTSTSNGSSINEESKVIALKNAIQEGIESGITQDFDPKNHLESLKAKKQSDG
jgi:antitoxin ParD1/3/4